MERILYRPISDRLRNEAVVICMGAYWKRFSQTLDLLHRVFIQMVGSP